MSAPGVEEPWALGGPALFHACDDGQEIVRLALVTGVWASSSNSPASS
jgi:hypothetical protein